METNILIESITIETIVALFKNTTNDKKRLKDIKKAIVSQIIPEGEQLEFFPTEEKEAIEERVEVLIKEDKKLENESFLKYSNGFYTKRPNRIGPRNPNRLPSIYTGTAGETAVLSELMFNGYNANRMMIDEGIDIIATKNNTYSYIQVKTSFVENEKVYFSINDNRYEQYMHSQLRYVLVARYNDKGVDKNMFFVFTQHDIDKGIHDKYIMKGQSSISIKIKFHPRTAAPILYDDNESDASYHLNNFKLI